MSMIESFETMLAQGKDNPLLRFSLGNAYLKAGVIDKAKMHLRAAVMQDGNYSAAWKLLGKTLSQTSDVVGAKEAYLHGITVANAKGDKQTAREIAIFLRRLG